MIRDADVDDIPALLEMGARFAEVIKLNETVGYCPATTEQTFRNLIDAEGGILLITDGGAAGGLVHPSIFNAAHITGTEVFWWVDPDKRGGGTGLRLLKALEQAAQARGAMSFMMATVETLNFEGATKYYGRQGYSPCDRNFIKVF